MDTKAHWEKVYATKSPKEVSWTQEYPTHSMEMVNTLAIPKSAPIIDVGGGESSLAAELITLGYTDITVLDISQKALDRAKVTLGEKAKHIQWICSDILSFSPKRKYHLWHDRAAFHFLTSPEAIQSYVSLVNQQVEKTLLLGTFSKTGPEKCSGLPVTQYSCSSIATLFSKRFKTVQCHEVTHTTPFNTQQNFIFTRFDKID